MAMLPNTPANPSNIIDILGPNGRPYSDRSEDNPPRMTDVDWTDRNVGTYQSMLQWAAELPGFNEDALIQNRSYEEADRILQYSAFISPFSILCDAITWQRPEVVPAIQTKSENSAEFEKAADMAKFCRYLITNIVNPKTGFCTDFRSVIYSVLDAVRVGFSVVEKRARWYEDGPYQGKLGLAGFTNKEQRQIGFWLDRKTLEPLAINSYTPLDGYEWDIPIEKFLLYTFQPRKGLPYGWGVFRTAHRHIVILDLLTKLWSVVLERFGGGFLIGHFDSQKQKQMLLDAMTVMKRGAGVALPRGLEITLEQMSGNGIESLAKAIEYHKSAITEIILGQTLTTEQGARGSYAHANVHAKTQEFKMTKVRNDIEFLVKNQLFRPFVLFNFGPAYENVIPSFSLGHWDWDVVKMIADTIKVCVDAGMVGAKAPFIRQRLGFPAYDPETEGELTIEPGQERVVVNESTDPNTGKTTSAPSRLQQPAQKPLNPSRALYVPAGSIILPQEEDDPERERWEGYGE